LQPIDRSSAIQKGLFFLAFTEAGELFSFYGMTALLVLYMAAQMLLSGHVENIAVSRLFAGPWGPSPGRSRS
jgi:dipeptide/tripeptide permease